MGHPGFPETIRVYSCTPCGWGGSKGPVSAARNQWGAFPRGALCEDGRKHGPSIASVMPYRILVHVVSLGRFPLFLPCPCQSSVAEKSMVKQMPSCQVRSINLNRFLRLAHSFIREGHG